MDPSSRSVRLVPPVPQPTALPKLRSRPRGLSVPGAGPADRPCECPAGGSDLGVRVSIAGAIIRVLAVVHGDQALLHLIPRLRRSSGLPWSGTRRAALAIPMRGGRLFERTMLPADDDDLLLRMDVLGSAVVVPIAMRLVESSERVLLRELPSPTASQASARDKVRREAPPSRPVSRRSPCRLRLAHAQ